MPYYLLCREALNDEAVADWLRDDHVNFGLNSDDLLFGFGCASRTTRLPNFVVAQHASAFMPTIVDGLTGGAQPSIGMNHLDSDFRPAGWQRLDAPEFVHTEPVAAPDWVVRLHPDLVAFFVDERAKALPNETGGSVRGVGCGSQADHAGHSIPPAAGLDRHRVRIDPRPSREHTHRAESRAGYERPHWTMRDLA